MTFVHYTTGEKQQNHPDNVSLRKKSLTSKIFLTATSGARKTSSAPHRVTFFREPHTVSIALLTSKNSEKK
jgi:hypothetical protein